MKTLTRCVGVALFVCGTHDVVAQAAGKIDTVDVRAGNGVVDFSHHRPGTSRAFQEMTMGETRRSAPPVLWRFVFTDTGARPLLLVSSSAEGPIPPGMPPQPVYVFDRSTLALRAIVDPATSAPQVTIDGMKIAGQLNGPNGPIPVTATLTAPAFFRPLADLVAESLPRRLGVVYKVPLWAPPTMAVEMHLYQFVRRDTITIRDKKHNSAWVLEDRSADGSQLLGTMWIIDEAPHLVRWIINQPNGAVVRLDQEVGPG